MGLDWVGWASYISDNTKALYMPEVQRVIICHGEDCPLHPLFQGNEKASLQRLACLPNGHR